MPVPPGAPRPYRYDAKMRHEWDVVVVGAGIIGLATGRELARRGARTVILEAHAAASGATQASAGMLAPHIEAAHDDALHQLTVRSLGLYDRFVAEVERDSGSHVEYGRRGTLELALDAAAAGTLTRQARRLADSGVEAEWLDGGAAAAMEPAVVEPHAGLFIAPHGYVRVGQLASALASAARQHGATLVEHAPVEAVRAGSDGAVDVSAGGLSYRAPAVVVAAGSWSGTVGPAGPRVSPVRGQLLQLAWQGPVITRVLWTEHCYIVPWSDGSLLVGATVEEAGFDQRNTVEGVGALLAAAARVLPAASRATFVAARAGLRPGTPDGLPFIGRSADHPGIVYATGHYRNGVLLAPLTAALVADLVIDGREDPALALTAPGR